MRIVCLPVDSRPCNTQFVQSLALWAGSECVLPRAEEMDDFRRPAPYAGSRAFLQRELPGSDAAVISLDHWCYGSLLASRDDSVPLETALERVDELRALLSAHPEVPVFMSTVVMRSSISTLSRDDWASYRAMTAFSVASDRFSRFGLEEDRLAMERARAEIPPELLERVLRVRERNLRVNLAAVRLAADGLAASLSVLQEDSQEYGLPKADQRRILELMRRLETGNVFLRNGTDEAGAVSLACALRRGKPPLEAELVTIGQGDFIAPYEDRPFRENIESACREIGIRPRAGSPVAICVCCPEHGEQEEASRPADAAYLGRCAAQIDRLIEQGRRVYLLDIVRANGGSPALVSSLRHPQALAGYSAWNTASNSMGTLLGQVVSDETRGAPNRAFCQERLLDDLIYQGVLRDRLQEELLARGEDVYCLSDRARAEEALRALLRRELPALWPLDALPGYRVSLPWDRTFEVRVEVLP